MENKLEIIALYGLAKSGKSTVAEYLESKHGYQRRAFATPLKEVVIALFGLEREHVYDPKLKETVDEFWGVKPRQMMQIVGTELIRETLPKHLPSCKNLWIRLFIRNLPTSGKVVVEDCRFMDEVNVLRERGAKLIQIKRMNQNQNDIHASEQSMSTFIPDVVISNNGTLDELYQAIETVLF